MKGLRSNEFYISLVLLTTLLGHVVIQSRYERRMRLLLNEVQTGRDAFDDASFYRADSGSDATAQMPDDFWNFLREKGHTSGSVVPAVDVQSDDQPQQTRNKPAPKSVPSPADAEPAARQQDTDENASPLENSAVRSVIEQELSHSSREEREIWYEELKTVPPEVVRDLLKVRKQFHALPRLMDSHQEKVAAAEPRNLAGPREIPAEPASQKIRFDSFDQVSSASALELALSQLRHNLLNASTMGFKRLRVAMVDEYRISSDMGDPDSEAQCLGDGCRMAPLVVDHSAGTLENTGEQFDLAIQGDGFFVVQSGHEQLLTRCGAFCLNRDRQLALSMTKESHVLQPVLQIPDDVGEVQISASGLVTAVKLGGTTELLTIGQLQLGRVASPALLTPIGQTLFKANPATGPMLTAVPQAAGFGGIEQGFLEQSNVDAEAEQAQIEQLTQIMKSLSFKSTRSATAGNLPDTPQR